jgi:hypothetical protein
MMMSRGGGLEEEVFHVGTGDFYLAGFNRLACSVASPMLIDAREYGL